LSRSKVATLCAGSVYPLTGGNDSSKDYWQVLKNGDLYDDGKDDQISFEDGRETIKTGKGKQGTLEQYLGMKEGTGYSLLMQGAGFKYDSENKHWTVSGKTISASAIQGLVDKGLISNDFNNPVIAYNKQRVEGYKKAYADGERKEWEKEHADIISRLTKDNPVIKDLVKQSDPYFSLNNPDVYKNGCLSMDELAYCQLALGVAFPPQEIESYWNTAKNNKWIDENSDLQIAAYSKLTELALQAHGVDDYNFEFNANTHNGVLVGYIGKMPFEGGSHFAAYWTKNDDLKPFYNSGQTNVSVQKWRPVYLYQTRPKKP